MARFTRAYVRLEPVTPERLAGAIELACLSTELDPECADGWHELLQLAVLADDTALQDRTVDALLRLEPANDVIRLRRLNREIERHQTLEDRSSAYERLLSTSSRDALGPALSSRLALDYALLLRRAGEVDGFARWLGEAAAIDPSNRTATAIAAGFFSSRIDDPYATAELFVAAVLSDPTDLNLQLELATHLLRNGAYEGAARMYDVATRNQSLQGYTGAPNLYADFALALWGSNQHDRALTAIHEQQKVADTRIRFEKLEADAKLTPVDVSGIRGHISPPLASIRAAIGVQRQQPDWQSACQQLLAAYKWSFEQLAERIAAADTATAGDPEERAAEVLKLNNYLAELRLEAAFVALWLAGDYATATEQLELAEQQAPLSEAAKARFHGWIALRRGEPETALALLEPLAPADTGARLGAAEAMLLLNRTKDAAKNFLDVARSEPGSALGVWSGYRLWSLIGRAAPLSESAERLNELIDSMPLAFDRLPGNATMALGFSITPRKTVFEPFESITLDLTVANRFQSPLAIDTSGPIKSQAIVTLHGQMAHTMTLNDLQPMVIELSQRLRLLPGESLTIPIDLRRYPVGGLLTEFAVLGAGFRAKAVGNPRIDPTGVATADLLGSDVESISFRVNGARLTAAWANQAMADVTALPVDQRAPGLVLLANAAGTAGQIDAAEVEAMRQQIVDFVNTAVVDLDPNSQAWVLLTIPLIKDYLPLRDMLKRSTEEPVRIAYLLSMLESETDPYIDTAIAEGSERVRRVALMARSALELRTRARELEQKQSQGANQSAPPQQ